MLEALENAFSPAVYSPEKKSKEDRSAAVHPHRITQFVGSSRIRLRVNRDITADEKIWQSYRHHCSMDDPLQESGPSLRVMNLPRGEVHDTTNHRRHYYKRGDSTK